MQRKYKVTTSVTSYMWAYSRDDAAKFQEELLRKEHIDIFSQGKTEVKLSFRGGKNFIYAPEDISKTRDPIEEPRRGDWLEIEDGEVKACALVRRLSRRKVYYYEALSKTERSVDRERWKKWAKQHVIHPSYDGIVPPFIVEEVINSHEERGLLNGFNATPDSSLILEILDKYGYIPDDYEVENGYWAETYIDQALSERILQNQDSQPLKTGTDDDQSFSDFSIGFSEELPTLDDLENQS